MSKTGISMCGTIENTRKIKSVKSNCSNCYHNKKNKFNVQYCDYYKCENPSKRICKRFSRIETLSKEEKDAIKKHNNELKRKKKEANTPRKTSMEKLEAALNCKLTREMIFSNGKRNAFGNGKFKIQGVESQGIIDVFFNDKNKSKQRYIIIK